METLSQFWYHVLEVLGAAHPAWLFLALAFLPLVGVPASPLIIAAGVRLGTWGGFVLAMAGLLSNFSLGYWLARLWLRRPLAWLLARRGYQIPQLTAADETQFILLFRITPGIPLTAQNYLLGLAQVNFRRYLLISLPVQAGYALAFVWLGHSLAGSATWRLILGGAALVALGLVISLLRRWMVRRKAVQSAPAISPVKP